MKIIFFLCDFLSTVCFCFIDYAKAFDCSLPGSSLHGILQARVLEWVAISFSGPITSWQIDGETATGFIFLGSKITADSDCSHEIKRHLLLRRKAMTDLDSVLESRDIVLSTKVHLVKVMVFPVVMYRCESWTIKKIEMLLNCGAGEDS